jgi:hypothetical protein
MNSKEDSLPWVESVDLRVHADVLVTQLPEDDGAPAVIDQDVEADDGHQDHNGGVALI